MMPLYIPCVKTLHSKIYFVVCGSLLLRLFFLYMCQEFPPLYSCKMVLELQSVLFVIPTEFFKIENSVPFTVDHYTNINSKTFSGFLTSVSKSPVPHF